MSRHVTTRTQNARAARSQESLFIALITLTYELRLTRTLAAMGWDGYRRICILVCISDAILAAISDGMRI